MVEQQQAGTLFILFGVKDYVAALTVVASSGILCCNFHGAAELFGSGGNVERVQPLMIVTTRVFTHCDDINGPIGAHREINDGSGSHSNFGCDLFATPVIGGSFASGEHGHLPKGGAVISVEAKDRVVFARHKKNVVGTFSRDAQASDI